MEHNSKNRHRHSDPDKYTDGKRDRNDKYKERADRALRDLRERLLNKRSRKGHKSKERDSEVSKKVEQEHSEVYIKEIIKISADRQRTTSTGHRTVYIEHNDDKCGKCLSPAVISLLCNIMKQIMQLPRFIQISGKGQPAAESTHQRAKTSPGSGNSVRRFGQSELGAKEPREQSIFRACDAGKS